MAKMKKIKPASPKTASAKSAAGSINRGTGKTEPAPSIGRISRGVRIKKGKR
jgi:hypothetical protein